MISIFLAIVATLDIQQYHQQYLLCLVKGYGLFPPKNLFVAVCCFQKRRSGRGLETCAMEVREILIKKIEKGCQATLVFASREGGGC